MPSTYAHYRFGSLTLPSLPSEIRRTIGRFRRMYDMGLHGPDIFFYYIPVTDTGNILGHKYHFQTGKEFFSRVCRMVRLEGGEAAQAYLYGLLCHYALDAQCHPYVTAESTKSPTAHVRMESEFDRFLLELDGKSPAHTQDLSTHIQLTPGECDTVAKFYPGSKPSGIRSGTRNMALIRKVLSQPAGTRRSLVQSSLRLLSKSLPGLMLPVAPDPEFQCHDEKLLELFNRALSLYPSLLAQIQANLTSGAPLEDEFAPIFG